MFNYSIDTKPELTDPDGNLIKDLASPMFSKNARSVQDYRVLKMDKFYEMRPDLVSQHTYGSDAFAEFILKFSGIGNPFTLDRDDVLLIPNESQMVGMTAVANSDVQDDIRSGVEAQIRNYYKFVNQEYKSDSTSYDNLEKMSIPSGVIDTTKRTEYMVPYISEDGRTAVILKNGKLYFGEDSGVPSALDRGPAAGTKDSVRQALNDALTSLSDTNCLYNGMSLVDFTRASQQNNRQ